MTTLSASVIARCSDMPQRLLTCLLYGAGALLFRRIVRGSVNTANRLKSSIARVLAISAPIQTICGAGCLGKPDPSASSVSASAAPTRSDIRAAASGTVSRSQAITYCSGMAGKNLLFDTELGIPVMRHDAFGPDDDAERRERRCFFPLPPRRPLTVSLAVVRGRGVLRMAGSTCIALHT
jgi:hypothetical protein